MSYHAHVDLGDHFKTTLARDVYDMVLGDHISTGTTRDIYKHAVHDDLVVKLENDAYSFCNIAEFKVWGVAMDTELAKWFAPVERISANGTVLFMKRTTPVQQKDLPDKVPAFFTDLKAENFGWYEGRIVCHDYGYHKMLERGLTKRMQKADWILV